MALQPRNLLGKQRARGHRGIAVGLEIGDRLRGFPRKILAATVECGGGADFEIGDACVGGVEPAALLLVLRNGERQRPLAALDGGGRIAHLLVEDEKGRAVLQFLPAAATLPRKSVKTVLNICNSLL